MLPDQTTTVSIPGTRARVSLELPPDLARLRAAALTPTDAASPTRTPPSLPLIDAAAWREHTAGEHWLRWRARSTAERLRRMPIEILPGERIVGRPKLGTPSPEEQAEIDKARPILREIPPFPGGDPGHFHPDYERVFRLGLGGLRQWIIDLEHAHAHDTEKKAFYQACRTAVEGLQTYARRAADACETVGRRENAPDMFRHAHVCRKLADAPPDTFREALELMFLVTVGLWFGEDHPLTCPGRMDQTLLPFYQADLAAGRLSPQEALEWIEALFIQYNMILGPGSALAVMVGGRDHQGIAVTNDLTYLCLLARLATHLVYPTVALAWNEDLPDSLMDFACRVLAAGVGDPAFFNDDLIAAGLRDYGVAPEDAWNTMNSTCVEIKVVGASNIWVTQPYFNCAQPLLDEMHAVAAGTAPDPADFAEFNARIRQRLAAAIHREAQRLDAVWRQRAETGGFPLASCFTRDCLESGRDFDRGGARYNWVENSFVGLANLVDGLAAIRKLVFREKSITLAEFARILEQDYSGHEWLRRRILNRLPKYGNDDPEADTLAEEWADFLMRATAAERVGPHAYVPGFFCWVMHERLGRGTGATPDGRKAGTPLADGAGAAQGRDRCGPTASILSTTKWEHRAAIGGLVQNLKFAKSTLQTRTGRRSLRSLIETFLRRGGFEIQVNIVGREELLDARQHPEAHRDLLVRVAGYSDYFVHLTREMQNEIIARTAHEIL